MHKRKEGHVAIAPLFFSSFLEKLKIIIRSLLGEESLDAIHRDHKLIGNWKGRRECHIESDWLLIYMIESDRVVFERTGTHSDLFQS